MAHWKLITGAVLLASAAAAVPFTLLYVMGHNRAVQTEQKLLTEYARSTTARTQTTVKNATDALTVIESKSFTDCTPAHIAAMRISVLSHRNVGEMGFFQDGRLACTSWGKTETLIPQEKAKLTTRDGIGLHLHVRPAASEGHQMVGLDYRNHNVLVYPDAMVDVLVDHDTELAVTTPEGRIVATLNNPDPAIIRQALKAGSPGESGDMLFASDRSQDWITVAIQKRNDYALDFQRRRVFLIPAVIVCYVLIFLGVLRALGRLSPRAELEIAVRKREFVAYYQPIVNLKTGRCIGAEALARWIRPGGTVSAPNLFIPLAEQTGLIFPITDQIMRRVVEDMAELFRDSNCHISINLCASDAETGRPLPFLTNLLLEHNIDPERIWLETTERVFIHPDMARNALTRARNSGHTIAVDDFGTGYSSLSVLHSLPLDVLKIDKSFVDAIGSDSASARVIPHIIDMANELHLSIIAEGIEHESQAEFCRQRGVACGQGWLFGKPMEPKAFIRYFKENIATHDAAQNTAVV